MTASPTSAEAAHPASFNMDNTLCHAIHGRMTFCPSGAPVKKIGTHPINPMLIIDLGERMSGKLTYDDLRDAEELPPFQAYAIGPDALPANRS